MPDAHFDSTLLELPGHVKQLGVIRLGDDAFGRVKVKRAFIDLTGHAGDIGPGKQGEEPDQAVMAMNQKLLRAMETASAPARSTIDTIRISVLATANPA